MNWRMVGRVLSRKSTAVLLSVSIAISFVTTLGMSPAPSSDDLPVERGPSHEVTCSNDNYSVAVGEGHTHSHYSDGATTIHQNSDTAKSRGLNWIVATDHNAVPPQSDCDAENTADFLCIVGQEVTTADGHVLGWGLSELVSWNIGPSRNMNDIHEDIRKQGGLSIVAHPRSPGVPDEYQHFGTYDNFDGMEVYHGYGGYNAAFPTTMDSDAMATWESYLNAGIRKIAVGNSDSHDGLNDWNEGDLLDLIGAIGFPRNVVLAKELSREGILEAVMNGRLYITDGPVLNFTMDGHVLGDTIRSTSPVTLTTNLSGFANESSQVRLIRNGTVIDSWSVGPGWFSVSDQTLADMDSWYRAEIRTYNGGLMRGETYVAFTNPIFFDTFPLNAPPPAPPNLMTELRWSDVFLTWDPSPDPDVDRYHVYVSQSYDNFSFLYPVARTVGTNWTHEGAGIGNNEDFFYIVRAVDKMGYESSADWKAAKTSRFLTGGKHLISYPLVTTNNSLGSILQTVSFNRVWTYGAGGWQWHDVNKRYSDLATMSNTRGYWVNVTEDSYFVLAGAVPIKTALDLREGWNLIGYPSFLQEDVADLMASLPLRRVEGPAGGPPHFLRRYEAVDTIRPFEGYWFELSSNATWTVVG
jgi:hypothetical protein